MGKKKIIFRADGNSKTGLGHLYRLFGLVEIYRFKFDFVFVTKEDSVLEVIPSNYKVSTIPNEIKTENEAIWLSKKFNCKDYIIIADGYQFDSKYQLSIKDHGYFLVYIDDLVQEHMYADVVVNHSSFVSKEDYKSEVYTKFALGTNYSMLRPLFLEASKTERPFMNKDNAFVCFGGADFYDLTFKATQAFLEFSEVKEIHVIVGGAYKHKAIFELAKKYKKVKVYSNLNELSLYNLMKSCGLAIAPCSTISYELCCIGIHLIGGYFVENQKNIYNGFLDYNIFFDGGNFEQKNVSDFKELIFKVLKSPISEQRIKINNQFRLFNTNQKESFLSLLK